MSEAGERWMVEERVAIVPGRLKGDPSTANTPKYMDATSSLVVDAESPRFETNLSITGVRGGGGG